MLFCDINLNKSLQLYLWNIAIRSLNNQECDALEGVDALSGIPQYGKHRNTVIKYVHIYKNRQRKIKNYKQMQKLDENSTAIFESSLVDYHYTAHPQELENVSL